MLQSRLNHSKASQLSTGDYCSVLSLVGALGELYSADASPAETLRLLTASAGALVGAGVTWWSVVRAPDPSAPAERAAPIAVRSYVHGLDEATFARWEKGYLLDGEYRRHPMWGPFAGGAGRSRGASREELVDDRVWYTSPHVAEWSRGLGYDDLIVSAVPLGDCTEVYLIAVRPWGDRRFDRRELQLLELITGSASWLYGRHLEPMRDARGQLRIAGARARLPPRHRAILEQLLTGRSEKQIADATGLSLRTAHKYIEHVYRAFQVSSRAELMALWIR